MLWYKGWLETRGKILLVLFYAIFPALLPSTHQGAASAHAPVSALRGGVGIIGLYYAIVPLLLAGSGIKTQTLRARRGLHGSMFYTLSLPVSRLRLLVTRATLGFIEAAAILTIPSFGVLFLFPALRGYTTRTGVLEYWLALSVCGVMFYSIGVLLSTFLDDLTQSWGSMLIVVALWSLVSKVHVPAVLDVFGAMGNDSPLFTHSLPWAPMGVAIVGAAVLCTAAFMVVRAREY